MTLAHSQPSIRGLAVILCVLIAAGGSVFASGLWPRSSELYHSDGGAARETLARQPWWQTMGSNVVARPTIVPVAAAQTGTWEMTVYYTAVESFHTRAPIDVWGCPTIECSTGSEYLGSYPEDFVTAVGNEGAGRITSAPLAGRYLNWSGGVGFWLDTAPRDSRGQPLEPFVTAAADPSVAFGLSFRITDCGVDDVTFAPIPIGTCARLQAPTWVVRDRFTQGAVGAHVDLYIGEETSPNFETTSPLIISTVGSALDFGAMATRVTVQRSGGPASPAKHRRTG